MAGNLLDQGLLILPADVREKLAELDLELSEGDITQKGYEKKKAKLLEQLAGKRTEVSDCKKKEEEKTNELDPSYYNLKDSRAQQPYASKDGALVSNEGYSYVTEVPSLPSHKKHANLRKKADNCLLAASPGDTGHHHSRQRRSQRKITHNEKRYHSEVRQEAVQQALAALKTKQKPNLPMPSKRSSVLKHNSNNLQSEDLESSTDNESIPEEVISPDKEYNYPQDHVNSTTEPIIQPPVRDSSKGVSFNNSAHSERRPQHSLPLLPTPDSLSAASPSVTYKKGMVVLANHNDLKKSSKLNLNELSIKYETCF